MSRAKDTKQKVMKEDIQFARSNSLENVFGNDEERKQVNKQPGHSFKDLLIKTIHDSTHL